MASGHAVPATFAEDIRTHHWTVALIDVRHAMFAGIALLIFCVVPSQVKELSYALITHNH